MQGIVSVHIHTALENPHMIRKVLFLFEKIFCWQTEHLKTFQGVLYFYSSSPGSLISEKVLTIISEKIIFQSYFIKKSTKD